MVRSSITHDSHDVDASVIVEHEDVGGDARRHQVDVRSRHPLGPDSHLSHGGRRRACRHRVDGRVGEPCARTAFVIKPNVMHMSHILMQRANVPLMWVSRRRVTRT